MPVRQLSNASSAASASSSSETATSAARTLVTAGDAPPGGVSPAPAGSASGCDIRLVGDETRLGHQILIERVVRFEEAHHAGAGDEDRLERPLLHVGLVL